MKGFVFISFLLISLLVRVRYTGSTFPKCEDILKDDGEGGKPQCSFCKTERIKETCKALCDSSGCNKDLIEAESSSSSASKSESSSASESKSSSATGSVIEKESSDGSSKGGKKGRKNQGAPAKSHGKKKKQEKENSSKQESSKKELSSSSSQQSSSSSSSAKEASSSSSSNQGSSSSSNSNNDQSKSSSSGGGSAASKKVASTCNDIEPCVPIDEANKKMKQRCYATSMQPSCAAHCGYDTPFAELKAAFKNKECSIPDAREFLYSAANRKNNVKCCTEKGVLDGNRAEVCEPFCNPGSDKWTGKLKAEYLRCLGQFDTIMACHWASARP